MNWLCVIASSGVAQMAEVQRYMREKDVDVLVAMERVLGVKVGK